MENKQKEQKSENKKGLEDLFDYLEKRTKELELEEEEFKNKVLLEPKYSKLIFNDNNQ